MPPLHRFTSQAGPDEAHLRLLSTSDLHMRMMPHDYIADRPVTGLGLALAGAEIDAAREEAANSLLFDIGDALEGSPLDDRLALSLPPEGHPMMAAFEAVGVDAATLGNHDFNYGLAPLERLLAASAVPMTLANIVRALGPSPLRDTPFLPPVQLLRREIRCGAGAPRSLSVGVIGVAPPQTLEWDGDKIGASLVARDIVDTVRAWAPELRRQGADLIVVLCHSGIAEAHASPMAEHAAVPLAALDDVDVVLAGHAHGLFPDPQFRPAADAQAVVDPMAGTLHGKPATMPGYWGNRIGVVDLKLAHTPTGWQVLESAAALRPIRAQTPNPRVAAAVAAHHDDTLREVNRIVAQTPQRINTFFAQIADVPSTLIVNAAQADAVAQALIGRPEAELPILSATAPLRAGGLQGPDHYTDIPTGQITLRHIVDLYVYPNTLVALRLTGAELRAWLERSASAFHTVTPGQHGTELIDPRHPSYSFDVVAGVTYRIDLAAPPVFGPDGGRRASPGRIRDLCYAGRPIAEADRFVLATNSYRLGKGGNFPSPAGGDIKLAHPEPVREHLTRYLAAGGASRALPAAGWGFVPLADTTALFRTGRAAQQTDVPGMMASGGPVLSETGSSADGFRIYAFDLARAADLGPFP